MTRRSYRVTIEGELAGEAFAGASVTTERGHTIVIVRDQAELFGLMRRISNLGLTLLSAAQTGEPAHADAGTAGSQSPG
jgi:hypothetical protein